MHICAQESPQFRDRKSGKNIEIAVNLEENYIDIIEIWFYDIVEQTWLYNVKEK